MTSGGRRDETGDGTARPARVTMRRRILLAFGVMGAITLVVGAQAVRSVDHAGGLVLRTFDHALMSVSYARGAATDFAAMTATLGRLHDAAPGATRDAHRARLAELEDSFASDLDVARERALSARGAAAADLAAAAAASWREAIAPLLADADGALGEAAWTALDPLAAEVSEQLDLLVEHVSGDAFLFRRAAEAEVTASLRLNIAATVLSLGGAVALALLLARRLLGPVRAAAAAAAGIAAGRLDTPIPRAGRDELGALLGAMSVMRDAIRGRIADEQDARREAEDRFAVALDNMSQGLVMFGPDDRLRVVNRRFAEIHRLPPGAVAPGATHRAVLDALAAAQERDADAATRLVEEEQLRVARRQPGRHVRELPGDRAVAVSFSPMPDGGWVATHEDVSERRRAQARIAHMTEHDALTGLPNRVRFRERAEHAATAGGRLAVHCLNLNRFKDVNDALGSPAGDALLRSVAERLLACLGEGDRIARLGGDEFAVLQVGADAEAAEQLADRLLRAIAAPHAVAGQRIAAAASIGIALFPDDGAGAEDVLRNAQLALDQARIEARGGHRFFRAAVDNALRARRALEADLRGALADDALELHYQPVVDLREGGVSGFEALMRWNHPVRGRISPAEFIPLAEESELICALGAWALRTACAEAAGWPQPARVAVNVSPVQFRHGGVEEAVAAALAASGLPPDRLEVEVTESVLLGEGSDTVAVLHALRARGVRVAMDDFGTGYSSLATLRSFPFDKIKIDQSFVRGPGGEEPQSAAIVRAVSGLAAALGMRCTAEGVETAEQLARLRATGCTDIQGYLFSPPRPASEVPALLARLAPAARAVA